ncbi:hypothetical protein P9384_02435 [Bacillus pumilus]|uniref:hypothetical protein n=1 Tax=Bacillus pumilus TaxID=1408 RepID=UPI000D038529|nr:hypothetical protein [Bacillus pumilus]MBX7001871.1 hypothetical protein [Bacillus aerophilus]MBX7013605.1 hypothetical protein [Bacillus aerophilus]MCY7500674.1 hypothetical protein [Bacillus pumilus]MCY7526540.1 hypothetical protein [Bacillus pumilus]MED4439063.1 hypothetical protein [Bacillus pumilus]
MNFSILKVNHSLKLKTLGKNNINFFNKKDDISLFHFNQLDKNMFHVVFNINDIFQTGTKRTGNQHNFTYSSLVNCFFFLDNDYLLIENVTTEYVEDVISHIEQKTKTKIHKVKLSNDQFCSIKNVLDGSIKKLAYVNMDEDDIEHEFVNNDEFLKIIESYKVENMTILAESEYVSIYRMGKISVNNSDDQYLIRFTREIVNAI